MRKLRVQEAGYLLKVTKLLSGRLGIWSRVWPQSPHSSPLLSLSSCRHQPCYTAPRRYVRHCVWPGGVGEPSGVGGSATKLGWVGFIRLRTHLGMGRAAGLRGVSLGFCFLGLVPRPHFPAPSRTQGLPLTLLLPGPFFMGWDCSELENYSLPVCFASACHVSSAGMLVRVRPGIGPGQVSEDSCKGLVCGQPAARRCEGHSLRQMGAWSCLRRTDPRLYLLVRLSLQMGTWLQPGGSGKGSVDSRATGSSSSSFGQTPGFAGIFGLVHHHSV